MTTVCELKQILETYVVKAEGPGRGWWGPPTGTHGVGSQGGDVPGGDLRARLPATFKVNVGGKVEEVEKHSLSARRARRKGTGSFAGQVGTILGKRSGVSARAKNAFVIRMAKQNWFISRNKFEVLEGEDWGPFKPLFEKLSKES